jgi:hypothetical protein
MLALLVLLALLALLALLVLSARVPSTVHKARLTVEEFCEFTAAGLLLTIQ